MEAINKNVAPPKKPPYSYKDTTKALAIEKSMQLDAQSVSQKYSIIDYAYASSKWVYDPNEGTIVDRLTGESAFTELDINDNRYADFNLGGIRFKMYALKVCWLLYYGAYPPCNVIINNKYQLYKGKRKLGVFSSQANLADHINIKANRVSIALTYKEGSLGDGYTVKRVKV